MKHPFKNPTCKPAPDDRAPAAGQAPLFDGTSITGEAAAGQNTAMQNPPDAQNEPTAQTASSEPTTQAASSEPTEQAASSEPEQEKRPTADEPEEDTRFDGQDPDEVCRGIVARLSELARSKGQTPEQYCAGLVDRLAQYADEAAAARQQKESLACAVGSLRSAEAPVPPERTAFIRGLWRR